MVSEGCKEQDGIERLLMAYVPENEYRMSGWLSWGVGGGEGDTVVGTCSQDPNTDAQKKVT